MSVLTALSEGAFAWVWTASVHVTPLIVLVFLVRKLLEGRLTPGLRYALSCLVLAGLLLPAIPASPFSLGNLFPAWKAFERATPLLRSIDGPPDSATATNELPVAPRANAGYRSSSPREAVRLTWLSGCLGLLVVAAWRYRRWEALLERGRAITEPGILDLLEQARLSMGVRRPLALAAVDRLSSPAICGLRRLRLVLPGIVLRQLNPAELRLVFLHELAHVKRHDLLLNWVLMGVQFLHWFNPLVWLALHRLRADRELVCDAVVLARLGPGERPGYGQVLIKLLESLSVEHHAFYSTIPVLGNRSEIKRRIIMIKHPRKSSLAASVGTAMLALALGCATLTRAREEKADPAEVQESMPRSAVPAESVAPVQQHQPTLNSPRPESKHAQETGVSEVPGLVIEIDAKGNLRLGGRLIGLKELETELASWAARNPDVVLHLQADERTPVGELVKMWDAARKSKISKIDIQRSAAPPLAGTQGSSGPAATQTKVAEVRIEHLGPATVSDRLTRPHISLKQGDNYEPGACSEDVHRLYTTGLFQDIRVAANPGPQGWVVTYVVHAKPRLREIRFAGNTKFREAELRRSISSMVGGLFDEKKAFTDAMTIAGLYEKAGFKGTTVKYAYTIDVEKGESTVTFEIQPSLPVTPPR